MESVVRSFITEPRQLWNPWAAGRNFKPSLPPYESRSQSPAGWLPAPLAGSANI